MRLFVFLLVLTMLLVVSVVLVRLRRSIVIQLQSYRHSHTRRGRTDIPIVVVCIASWMSECPGAACLGLVIHSVIPPARPFGYRLARPSGNLRPTDSLHRGFFLFRPSRLPRLIDRV